MYNESKNPQGSNWKFKPLVKAKIKIEYQIRDRKKQN